MCVYQVWQCTTSASLPFGVEVEALLEAGEHALQFLWAGVAALIDWVASGGQCSVGPVTS